MTFGLTYDPRFHTWDSWASLMCELYAAQNLSAPQSEDSWREWAMGIKGIDIFANESVPDPNTYANWFDWAQALMLSVNPSPQSI
jgi:hypothetical protein